MSDLSIILITSTATLIGGTILFTFGEFVRVLVIIPLQKYKEQVQLTLDRLDFYANYITNYFPENPDKLELDLMKTISSDFRSAATQLKSKYSIISCNRLLSTLRIIPPNERIIMCYGSLIFISNNLPRKGRHGNDEINPIVSNHEQMDHIKNNLR